MADKRFMKLRKVHGKIHDYLEIKKAQLRFEKLVNRGYADSIKSSKTKKESTEDYPVDFVILWVDGNDPKWIAERQKYINNNLENLTNNTEARWREWDNLQYWFRGVEKYAPWVRNIYFVTWGHIPTWLNIFNPKLKIINHKEFIPDIYLPTFCTNPIELNLWRINGLSEHFVYFNDDMFLSRPVSKEDFFHNGFPKYSAIAKPIFPFSNMTTWEHQQFNVAGVVNSLFDIKRVIEEHPEKWFSYKYKDDVKYNVRAYEDGKISGMIYSHLGAPCRVSTMSEVWSVVGEQLDKTCMHKFRTMGDLVFQLFELWEIYKGSFEPVESNYYGFAANILPQNIGFFKEQILNKQNRMICINDSEQLEPVYFDDLKEKIVQIFIDKFPEKSSYEL